jgi:peptidoglycan/LPS O-acetylase OafA/YrhL
VTRPGPPIRGRNAALDGVRGLAALSVLVYHVWLYTQAHPDATGRDSWEDYVLHELRLGLVAFFVLSGFLLYGPWLRAALGESPVPRLGSYLVRRAARVMPAYYLALAGSVALLWNLDAVPGVRIPHATDLPLFAIFAENLFDRPLMALDPPMWTLSVEVSFYLLLPLVGWIALRAAGGRVRQAAVPLALLGLGVGWNAVIAGRGWPLPVTKVLPAMLPYFAAGMLAALLAHGRTISRRAGWGIGLAAVAAIGLDAWWHSMPQIESAQLVLRDLPAGVGFAALIAVAAHGVRSGRLVGARPVAALGTVSYGVYLWHVPLILWAKGHGWLPGSAWVASCEALAATLVVATASWLLVEKPVLAWAHRGGRSTATGSADLNERGPRPRRSGMSPLARMQPRRESYVARTR